MGLRVPGLQLQHDVFVAFNMIYVRHLCSVGYITLNTFYLASRAPVETLSDVMDTECRLRLRAINTPPVPYMTHDNALLQRLADEKAALSQGFERSNTMAGSQTSFVSSLLCSLNRGKETNVWSYKTESL